VARRYRITRRRRAGAIAAAAVVAVSGVAIGVLGRGETTPDISPPSAFIASPLGAVSGAAVTVAATCGDNVGCAGVQFKLDGANLLAEDTTGSSCAGTACTFSVSWDSTSVTNGAHTLTAFARDAANNTKLSNAVAITVSGAGGGSGLLANIFADPSVGNDGNCPRMSTPLTFGNATGHICATWNQAYHNALQGDIAGVRPGNYCGSCGFPAITADGSKTTNGSYVTFKCTSTASENVQIDVRDFWILGDHIKIDGGGNWRTSTPSCMRFRAIWLAGPTTSQFATDTIITGTHQQSVQMSGAVNATVSTTEDGPSIACKAVGDTSGGITSATWCHNDPATGEDWYFAHALANCGEESDTHIGWGNAGTHAGSGIVYTNNWNHDKNTRDPGGWVGDAGDGCHNGGMNSHGTVDTVTISRNTYEQNIAYDLGLDGSDTHVLVENNWLGTNVNTLATGCSFHACTEVGNGHAIENDNRNGATYVDWDVRFNTASETNSFCSPCTGGETYTNFRWVANLMAGFDCGHVAAGMTVDRNAFVGFTCGTNSTNLAGLGVNASTGYPIDFGRSGSPAVPTIDRSVVTGADYALTVDHPGATRNTITHVGGTGP
jgi:hypothetical protein